MTDTKTQNGIAATVRKTFSRETSVKIDINANASTVWALLTNATDYPRWNSTITSLEGNIALGETIRLKSILDAKRVFKLKVKELIPENKLVWGDAMGKRTFTITKNNNRGVTFFMTEKIGGPIFPLFAKMIPPFDESFEKFAMDLKKEAEKVMNAK